MRLYKVDYYSRRDDRKKYYIAFTVFAIVFGIAYLIWLSTPVQNPDKKEATVKIEKKAKKELAPAIASVLASHEATKITEKIKKEKQLTKEAEVKKIVPPKEKPLAKEEVKFQAKGIVSIIKVCRGVEKAAPLEGEAKFATGDKAFFYTTFNNEEYPLEIVHVWLAPNGKEIARIPLSVKSPRGRTWSYIFVGSEGKWQVRLEDANGKELAKTSFWVSLVLRP